MNKQPYRALLATVSFLVCAHFGSQDSSITGREKPAINFYGTLIDTSGNTFKVENITISGLYKQVPMYQKPLSTKIDPNINITRLDLNEIAKIEVPSQDTILTFNNRDYIEVIVTSSDPAKTTQSYITEKSKRVICDQINKAGSIEKDLSFQAIDSLTIEGHKTPPVKESPVVS